MLRCDRTYDRKKFKLSIQKAKKYALDYIIITKDDCEKPRKTPQQSSPKKETSSTKPSINHKEHKKQISTQSSLHIETKPSNINELKKLFQKRKSYTVAVTIARSYFKKGDYKSALKWAKQANTLDAQKEESWLLYAKSLYHLGEKKSAIKLLHFYLKFQNSSKVEELLHKWENEK